MADAEGGPSNVRLENLARVISRCWSDTGRDLLGPPSRLDSTGGRYFIYR